MKIGYKFSEQWLLKAKILGQTDKQTPDFRKLHQFKAAILLYLSSLERESFVKLKKTIVLLCFTFTLRLSS